MPKSNEFELTLLLEAIYQKYHYDFRGYSKDSVARRLSQAKERFNCRSYSILQDRVLHEPAIFPELLSFLTVQVSEMFRDPIYFRSLRENVIPYLKTYPSLKVWVAGCSSGEELYSLAILFREEGIENRTIFYGTDINNEALRKAERGIYPIDRIPLFTHNHQLSGGKSPLSDYYTAAYGLAVFDKSLRDRAVFSDHSLVSDSVFAEVQLVSCRNVLIYFAQELQDRAIGLFKDALSRKGFLGLGSKESLRLSQFSKEFIEFEKSERIYQKNDEISGGSPC